MLPAIGSSGIILLREISRLGECVLGLLARVEGHDD